VTRRKADTEPTADDAAPKRARTRTRAKAAPSAVPAPATVPAPAAVDEPATIPATAATAPAMPPEDGSSPGWEAPDFGRLVVFGLDGQRYALPLDDVQEIQQIVAFSDIPDGSSSVVGVINLRGDVVPAVDLRLVVGMPVREYDLQTPMVIARTSRGLVAFVVDSVEDVVEVSVSDVQPPSAVYELADRLRGVCRLEEGIVFVFDVEKLLPSRGGRRKT
jgi:purine-binding chemotaxis protein CheW